MIAQCAWQAAARQSIASAWLPPALHATWRGAKAKPAAKGGKQQAGRKAATPAKPKKQKGDSTPMSEKDPLLNRVIAMVLPQKTIKLVQTEQELADAAVYAKEYSRIKLREHRAWQVDLKAKLVLRKRACMLLPHALRKAAMEEDLTPFPPARNIYFATPPQAYLE